MIEDNILNSELFKAFAQASEFVYIYVCDMKTGLSRWSPSAIYYFDLPGEFMENAGEIWGERIHPEDRQMYMDDIETVFSGKQQHHSCQYRARNRYGEYIWLECKGSVIRDKNGELSVFAGLMTRLDNQNKYDSLTGLMTTHEFYKSDFTEGKGTVILLGIDGFRNIISAYGYHFGDEVLVDLAKLLSDMCTDGQLVYRFSGDEFVVVLPDLNEEEAREVYRNIRSVAKKNGLGVSRKLTVSISAGAVSYPLQQGNVDDIVNRLELSLEFVKRSRKGHMLCYSSNMEEMHLRSAVMKEDLKHSIKDDFSGFELYYQPWVDARGTRVIGCEALLRWKGKKITDAGPVEFIPILEETGDIVPVGRWVMEQAMKQQKEWQDKYGDFQVSFNVSYQQFLEENYVQELMEATEKYQVQPNRMVLELTESSKIENPENLAVVFGELCKAGFRIALDDFGTAYASMELLKKLPADCIKIEHSFVRELSKSGHEIDFSIIESLLYLCKKLGYESVVEGVENQDVDGIIRNMEATYLQGYYYSKPINKEEFEKLLEQNRRGE